jgi:hypothetical protein
LAPFTPDLEIDCALNDEPNLLVRMLMPGRNGTWIELRTANVNSRPSHAREDAVPDQ